MPGPIRHIAAHDHRVRVRVYIPSPAGGSTSPARARHATGGSYDCVRSPNERNLFTSSTSCTVHLQCICFLVRILELHR